MAFTGAVLFVASFACFQNGILGESNVEPSCYSRFDYESKMLERIVMVEHKMNLLQESTKDELLGIKSMKNEMLTEMKNFFAEIRTEFKDNYLTLTENIKQATDILEAEQSEKMAELDIIGVDLQNTSRLLDVEQKEKLSLMQQSIDSRMDNLRSEMLLEKEEMFRNLTEFEIGITERNEAKLSEMEVLKTEMKSLSNSLKEEQRVKLEAIEIIGNEIKVEIQERMLKLEAADKQQDEDYAKVLRDFKEAVNNTWTEIRTEGFNLKPAVMFHYQDVASTYYSDGQTAVFITRRSDTHFAYDTSNGDFTAPVKGAYLFSVQICGYQKSVVNFRIYTGDAMLTDSSMFDYDSDNTCVTSNAVAYLAKGDTVSVKAGPSGMRVHSEEKTRSAFMGILVH